MISLGEIKLSHLAKVEKKIGPEKKYLLSELLLLVPTKRKSWVPIIKKYFTKDKIKKISLSADEKKLIVEYDNGNINENGIDNLPKEQIKLHAYLVKNSLKSLTKKELLKKDDHPLRKQIEKLIKEIKYTEFDAIPFHPDKEINEVGNKKNHWENTWQEYLDTVTDELDLKLKWIMKQTQESQGKMERNRQ